MKTYPAPPMQASPSPVFCGICDSPGGVGSAHHATTQQPAPSHGATLPFTGIAIYGLLAAAIILLAVGAVLSHPWWRRSICRRYGHDPRESAWGGTICRRCDQRISPRT